MRRFILLRVEDVSGSSGTGRVAEGIVADAGYVILFFADSFKWFPDVETMMEIHGHEGRTRFHWQDWPKPPKVKTERVWETGTPPDIEIGMSGMYLVRENKNMVPRVVVWYDNDDGDTPWPAPTMEWSKLDYDG